MLLSVSADVFANSLLTTSSHLKAKAEIRRHFLYSTGVVGSGQFGEVHLAHLDARGVGGPKGEREAVAVKMLKMSAPAENRDEFVRECEAMLQLKHPNLCELKGVSVRRRPWLCIIEVMKYGDIHSLVKKCKAKSFELNLAEQLHIAIQTCRGMARAIFIINVYCPRMCSRERTLLGCCRIRPPSPLTMVGAPRQCPRGKLAMLPSLDSYASFLFFTDVFANSIILMLVLILAFKGAHGRQRLGAHGLGSPEYSALHRLGLQSG